RGGGRHAAVGRGAGTGGVVVHAGSFTRGAGVERGLHRFDPLGAGARPHGRSLADRAAGLAGGSCDSRSVLYVGGGVPVRAGGGGAGRGGGINPGGRAGLWHRTAPAEGPKKTGTGLMAGHRPRARRPPRGLVVPPALAPARARGAGRRLADRVVHPAGAVLSFQAVQLLLWLDALPFRAVF